MTTLFNYLLIFNVFAGGFVLFFSPFEFYLGYIFIIAFLIIYVLRYRKFDINFTFLLILIWLTNFSLVNVYFGNDALPLMLKQVVGILITGSAYYLLVKVNKYEIDKLFKIYLKIALFVAIIGIIQECSFLIGFKYGYDYSWLITKWKIIPVAERMLRVNSIFMESSHFAISMAPAFFISLLNITRKDSPYFNLKWSRWGNRIIILSYILTFSMVAYIVIFISLILLFAHHLKKPKNLILALVILLILSFSAYFLSSEIRIRVDDAVEVAKGKPSSHLTVYAYVSNAYVASKSFKSNPIFGSGLGSHPIAYDKFMASDAGKCFLKELYTGINKADANSLLLRLISETGLFGVIVVFYFIFRFFIKSDSNKNLQIINNAIFVLFIAQLIRQGHYFYNGLFFFVWLYYFSYKINNKPDLEILESENH